MSRDCTEAKAKDGETKSKSIDLSSMNHEEVAEEDTEGRDKSKTKSGLPTFESL